MWRDLLEWLKETEKSLSANSQVGNDPVTIKAQITKHKEFQRGLGTRQPIYDSVCRSGRTLKEKCPSEDVPKIQQMLTELKGKWNALCGMSVDR